MDILVKNLINITNPNKYKIHFAVWNKTDHPLDVFVRDREEWARWNSHRGTREDFNRQFIFSLIRYYHQPNRWLFGGIFEIVARKAASNVVKLLPLGEEYVGRLLVNYPGPGARGRAFYLEKHFGELKVAEILEEAFEGETWGGYENIEIGFSQLEEIIRRGKTDWKAALEHVKGVYLIVDRQSGKKYVGSAYGDYGIWSRWEAYVDSGHGGNSDLRKLVRTKGIDYARKNFHFSILEFGSMRMPDKVIIGREQYWKRVLRTIGDFGHNRN